MISPDSTDELLASPERIAELRTLATGIPSWDLTERQLCDIELLLNGGFAPLRGFLGQEDYESVCNDMRLSTGELWPIPITLDVSVEFSDDLSVGQQIALRHPEGMTLAVLTISDVWRPDKEAEAKRVFGTTDEEHPAVFTLNHQTGPIYLGGEIEGLEFAPHHDFQDLRLTPAQTRARFKQLGWEKVVGFQTRNPLHRVHVELTRRAAAEIGGGLLLHPVVGMTKPGDVDYFTRARCYKAVLPKYPADSTTLGLLPLAMRMAGPREAIWHAIIRKNFGCTHLVVGRDHAGPGRDSNGELFYGPYDAQELMAEHQEELGITAVSFKELVYSPDAGEYLTRDEVPAGNEALSISGTQFRKMLANGEEIPEWFSYPIIVEELRKTVPRRSEQGFTVLFTGLPSSGKSTLARVLISRLMELGGRAVTFLDGDHVRKLISSGLGFSKEDRQTNVRRIGYIASEVTKHGGIAVCSPIAPHASVRREFRERVSAFGGMVEVYVSTPLEVCEERDRKGFYAAARRGEITEFTGVSDPYDAPENPEVEIDTSKVAIDDAIELIMTHLRVEGYLE